MPFAWKQGIPLPKGKTTLESCCGKYLESKLQHCTFLESMNMKKLCGISLSTLPDGPLNFVLIDGPWNNSAAMFARLKAHVTLFWGQEEIPCVSLSTQCASVMHKLRAAAAMHLLLELHLRPEFSSHGLDKQAEAVENGLDVLFEALTGRRHRMGRSTSRRERHNSIEAYLV